MRQYEASIFLEAGGASGVGEIINETFFLGSTSITGLLGDFGADISDVQNAIGFVLSEPFIDESFADIFGDPGIFGGLTFDISSTTSSATTISGVFALNVSVTGDTLQDIQFFLAEALDISTFEPQFGFNFNASIAPVPVPAALPMLLGGLVFLGWYGRRRRTA